MSDQPQTDPPLSCRAFAKLVGVTPMAVSFAIRDGRLALSVVRDANGQPKIGNVALALEEWAANTDHDKVANARGSSAPQPVAPARAATPAPAPISTSEDPEPDEDPEGDGAEAEVLIDDTTGRPMSAIQRGKHWDALMRELKFKRAARELVAASDVAQEWTDLASSIRSKLLGVPTQAKQAIPTLSTADVEILENLIRDALEDLAGPREGATDE